MKRFSTGTPSEPSLIWKEAAQFAAISVLRLLPNSAVVHRSMFCTVVLLLLLAVGACYADPPTGTKRTTPPIDLRATKELVFTQKNRVPRLNGPALDSLRCEGKHCSHVSTPEAITCVNRFEPGTLPTWDCTGVFEGGYKLRWMKITCERQPGESDLYIADSCRLIYTLYHPSPSIENHEEDDDILRAVSVTKKCPECYGLSVCLAVAGASVLVTYLSLRFGHGLISGKPKEV